MTEWNEEERRQKERDDHDLLTKIDVNLSNFMRRFDEHSESDKEHFDRIYRKTSNLQKFLYMAMGAFAAVETYFKVFK